MSTLRRVEKQVKFVCKTKDTKRTSAVVLETSNYVLRISVLLKLIPNILLIICFLSLEKNIFATKKDIF